MVDISKIYKIVSRFAEKNVFCQFGSSIHSNTKGTVRVPPLPCVFGQELANQVQCSTFYCTNEHYRYLQRFFFILPYSSPVNYPYTWFREVVPFQVYIAGEVSEIGCFNNVTCNDVSVIYSSKKLLNNTRGVNSRMCPPYPQRVEKATKWGWFLGITV